MQYGFLLLRHPLALIALTVLAGCVPASGNQPLESIRTPGTVVATASLPTGDGAFPDARWWLRYHDPALDGLIDEALNASPDMAAALARTRAAEALAQQSGAALYPTATADGTIGGNRQSYNLGIPAQFVPRGLQSTGRLTLGLAFDPDLWGRNRAALAAATSEAEAARVDAAQAQMMLETGLALAWSDFAQLWSERDVAADAVRVRADTARLTEQRVKRGMDPRSQSELANSRLASARGELASIDEAIGIARHRIAALVGAGPDRGLSLPRPVMRLDGEAALPPAIALDLVSRRPDLQSARLRAEAMASRIKVAKAAFYPNINLAAMIGLQSFGLSDLLTSDSTIATLGPALNLPLFDGGARRGRLGQAQASYAEAVARYDATLLTAFRDTADAIESRRWLVSRLAEARSAARSAEEAARLARLRYEGGIDGQLPFLNAEDTALASRRTVALLEARALALDVMLVRALGGGFEMTPATKGKPGQ